ncbi:putative O-glycosylation ligase, exosortase A system-associated [Magnetococcales bacterium HHB-1]
MSDLVLTMFIFGMLPACFIWPRIGLTMWAWVGFMNPQRLTYGFAYHYRFVYMLALVTLLGIFFSKQIRIKIPWTTTTIILSIFIIWTSITTIFALNPHFAQMEWQRFLKIQIMTFVVLMLMTERRWIHYYSWVLAVSIGFWGIKGGIFTILTGGAHRAHGPEYSFFWDNNGLALALLISLPLMRYLQLHTRSRFLRFGVIGMTFLSVVTIFGTYSRGGLVGFAALMGAYAIKARKSWLSIFLAIIILPGLLYVMPDKWKDRMNTVLIFTKDKESVEADGSAQGRVNSWWFAVNLAQDHPLLGGGFRVFTPHIYRQYAPNPEDFHDAHSIYFEVIAEHGFAGFILFMLFYISVFLVAGSTIRKSKKHPELAWARDLSSMLQVSLVGYAAAGAFLGLAYFDLPYQYAALIILTNIQVRRKVGTFKQELQFEKEQKIKTERPARIKDKPPPKIHTPFPVPSPALARSRKTALPWENKGTFQSIFAS